MAAPHLVLNHFVDMSIKTPRVMTKGTVLQMYLDKIPGNTSCGLRENCHRVPKSKEPASRVNGFHMEKKTRARAMKPQPMIKL